jgi:hypothetical protein
LRSLCENAAAIDDATGRMLNADGMVPIAVGRNTGATAS